VNTAAEDLQKSWEIERIKRELNDCLMRERGTTGVDRRHWTEYTVIGDDNEY
jgi:hypothetical protein